MVTDLQLAAIDPNYANQLNSERFSPRLGQYLNQNTLYTNLAVMPALMLDRGPDPASPEYAAWAQNRPEISKPITVKTVPDHHAPVRLANAEDIAQIFGREDGKTIFRVGETREQGHLSLIHI